MESGRDARNILDILRNWLVSNKSAKALEIAASVFKLIGDRSNLDLLNEGSDHSKLALEILEDTRFAVYRRVLS